MADEHRHGCEERTCCPTRTCEHHYPLCEGAVDILVQEQAFLKDPERWIDGYTNHTATALARRAAIAVSLEAAIDFENTTMAINDNDELKRILLPEAKDFKPLYDPEKDYYRNDVD